MTRIPVWLKSRAQAAGRRLLRHTGPLLAAALAAGVAGQAHAANTRYADTTIFVRLKFDGDPSFPNLTSFRNTAGLGRFSGTPFGLTEAQRNEVVNLIVARLRERYAAFNVEFVTNNDGPSTHYTWGIDDSAYYFPLSNTAPCVDVGHNARLMGKAIGGGPNDTACDGSSLYQPRHARTWAGSFAMAGQGGVQSEPSLRLGGTLADGTPITVTHIARALANSATHEIGHLFGLQHVNCTFTDTACKAREVMFQATEAVEATSEKVFNDSNGHITALNSALGKRLRLAQPSRGLLLDPVSGVMLTQNPNLPATLPVGAVTPLPDGRLSFLPAATYAGQLDHLGYDDWRLPIATNPNPAITCLSPVVLGRVVTCDKSDLGRLFHRLLPWEPSNLVDSSHIQRPYWSTDGRGTAWLAQRNTREQYPATTTTTATLWPMRDSARLVDNGDGTITDTKRGLMWMKDAQLTVTRDWVQANSPPPFAGYSDWRAPRVDELRDYTCVLPARTPPVATTGCTRSELGHLFHGWGITTASPAPFTGLPSPASDQEFWFSTPIPGDLVNGLAYSMRTGQLRPLPRTTRLPVLLVRDFPNGVPAGRSVVADPDPRVTIRFNQVTQAGQLTASSVTPTPVSPSLGAPRTWSFAQSLAYVRGDRAVTICLRYDTSELPTLTKRQIGMRGPTLNGPGRMPVLPGYPDTVNQVVCAWAPWLDAVRVATFAL